MTDYKKVWINGTNREAQYGVYGSGDTLADAKKEFRSHGGSLSQGHVIVEFDAAPVKMQIGAMGMEWRTQEGHDQPKITEIAAK